LHQGIFALKGNLRELCTRFIEIEIINQQTENAKLIAPFQLHKALR